MEKIRKQKVVIYCVQEQKLLVFKHVDYSFEEVGIQVPAGSIREEETPEAAALRELQEETGKQCFVMLNYMTGNTSPHDWSVFGDL